MRPAGWSQHKAPETRGGAWGPGGVCPWTPRRTGTLHDHGRPMLVSRPPPSALCAPELDCNHEGGAFIARPPAGSLPRTGGLAGGAEGRVAADQADTGMQCSGHKAGGNHLILSLKATAPWASEHQAFSSWHVRHSSRGWAPATLEALICPPSSQHKAGLRRGQVWNPNWSPTGHLFNVPVPRCHHLKTGL